MKKETLIGGIVGLLVGVLVVPFIFGMWGPGFGYPYGHMMQSRGLFGPGMMGSDQFGYRESVESLDAHFIEQMIPHHEDAVRMAELALTRAEHEELKTLATNIKASQSREIENMRTWYQEWYNTTVPDISWGWMGSTGMMNHSMMMGSGTDLDDLENSESFDKEFIEQMIPHHQMALMMTSMMLRGTERPELQQLANDILATQSAEIEQMQTWYQEWYR